MNYKIEYTNNSDGGKKPKPFINIPKEVLKKINGKAFYTAEPVKDANQDRVRKESTKNGA